MARGFSWKRLEGRIRHAACSVGEVVIDFSTIDLSAISKHFVPDQTCANPSLLNFLLPINPLLTDAVSTSSN